MKKLLIIGLVGILITISFPFLPNGLVLAKPDTEDFLSENWNSGTPQSDPGEFLAVDTDNVTFTDLDRNNDTYFYRDFGVDHFDGDFEHLEQTYLDGGIGAGVVYVWMLANDIDDWGGIDDANGSALGLWWIKTTNTLNLRELDSGTAYTDTSAGVGLDVLYYVEIKRDENVGTYGTLYAYIATSDYYSDGGDLVDTLTLTLHTSKKDFRYLYAINSLNSGSPTDIARGFVQYLDIGEAATSPPSVTTNSVSSIEETTALFSGNITATSENCTEWGFQWGTETGVYTENWTDTGSRGIGNYTHSVSGLTQGELYYVRAMAENPYGWGYGYEVTFLTKPEAPTNLTTVDTGVDWASMTWTQGTGSQKTMIRHDTGGYPATTDNGTLGFFDAGSSGNVTDFPHTVTSYISAWSYATEGGHEQYSDVSDNTTATMDEPPLILEDGIWSWHQRPLALYYNNKTYFVWVNSDGDVGITCVNHTTGNTTSFELKSILNSDDHAAPAMLIRNSDQKLIIFYTGHSDKIMRWRISSNAEDISSFESEKTFTGDGDQVCYPQPVQLSGESNRIYLFYRTYEEEVYYWAYRYSDDNGDNFGSEVKLVQELNVGRPYTHPIGNGVDTIHFSVNDSAGGNGPSEDLLHFYYNDGSFFKSDGTLITDVAGLPLTSTDNMTMIYESTGNYNVKDWDIALDDSGNPVIVFVEYVDMDDDHRYDYATYNGTAWNIYEICEGGSYIDGNTQKTYSGGVYLNQDDTDIVYCAVGSGTDWEIRKYITEDGGANWGYTVLPANSGYVNARPVTVRGSIGYLDVIWWTGTYTSYTDFLTDIWGYSLIDYEIQVPTVTTANATGVGTTYATLNGNITDTGGENCDYRGWEWGLSTGNYTANWTASGSFGTGSYSQQITSFSDNTTYYFRAMAHNSEGWGYGSEKEFTTEVNTNTESNLAPFIGLDEVVLLTPLLTLTVFLILGITSIIYGIKDLREYGFGVDGMVLILTGFIMFVLCFLSQLMLINFINDWRGV